MHAKPWQIPLKRVLWAMLLMGVCSLIWSRASFASLRHVPLPVVVLVIVLAAVLQVLLLLIAIRVPLVFSRISALLGMLTLLLIVLWGMWFIVLY